MTSRTYISRSVADTDRIGAELAAELQSGTVVALIGTLGAGKTCLVQAIAAALGVPRDVVTSPTFVLVNEYRQGRLPIFHFDAYRLKDIDEFLELGPEEYFDANGLTFIEWADRVAHALPKERLEIELSIEPGDARKIDVRLAKEVLLNRRQQRKES
ncbi:MAG: tRNA (adenosine(37)-N6)-threonylcarbamoyltransferase complex ATPase subunit type 1 TsaE [Pirellulales bacterium]